MWSWASCFCQTKQSIAVSLYRTVVANLLTLRCLAASNTPVPCSSFLFCLFFFFNKEMQDEATTIPHLAPLDDGLAQDRPYRVASFWILDVSPSKLGTFFVCLKTGHLGALMIVHEPVSQTNSVPLSLSSILFVFFH